MTVSHLLIGLGAYQSLALLTGWLKISQLSINKPGSIAIALMFAIFIQHLIEEAGRR